MSFLEKLIDRPTEKKLVLNPSKTKNDYLTEITDYINNENLFHSNNIYQISDEFGNWQEIKTPEVETKITDFISSKLDYISSVFASRTLKELAIIHSDKTIDISIKFQERLGDGTAFLSRDNIWRTTQIKNSYPNNPKLKFRCLN